MNILILDKTFQTVAIVDYFESVLWNDRYAKSGDFEIYTTPDSDIVSFVSNGYYLWNKESEHQMIMERIVVSSENDGGNKLIVSGRSLESILDRRILWDKTTLNGNLQNEIKRLLNENFINPTDPNRKIENMVFLDSTDEKITSLTIDSLECEAGKEIYDIVEGLCDTYKIGFKLIMDDDYNFVFSLYCGEDRSYNQEGNPYITFSKKYQNLIDSEYVEDSKDYKTLTLVVHENGEGELRSETTVSISDDTGLYRREIFTTANNIEDSDTPEQILTKMIHDGRETLNENRVQKDFECELDPKQVFVYGKDFYLGDVVQVVDSYGIEFRARVTEYMRSYSDSGIEEYPSFEVVDDYFEGE